MSERAWDWAWRRRGLTPTRRLVLLALAEYAEDNGETCMPAPWLLRRMTGLSRRGVAKTLNALEAAGLIASEPGGCDGATRYRLLLDRPGPALDCPGGQTRRRIERWSVTRTVTGGAGRVAPLRRESRCNRLAATQYAAPRQVRQAAGRAIAAVAELVRASQVLSA